MSGAQARDSRRRYGQLCPIATALDAVGDRWAMLVLRDLAFGPLRFGDLAASVGAIPPATLSARLADLLDAGLVERHEVPPPTPATLYQLTDAGLEAVPVLSSLARLGATLQHDRIIDGHTVLAGLRRRTALLSSRIDSDAVGRSVAVRAGTASCTVGLGPDGITVGDTEAGAGPDERADAVLHIDPRALLGVMSGALDVATARADPGVRIEGDSSAALALLRALALTP